MTTQLRAVSAIDASASGHKTEPAQRWRVLRDRIRNAVYRSFRRRQLSDQLVADIAEDLDTVTEILTCVLRIQERLLDYLIEQKDATATAGR